MNVLLTEIEARWHNIFSTLKDGGDASPGLRLRTEGLMEAAILCGETTPENLTTAMETCYANVYGCPIAQEFTENWQELFPFPQIPAMGNRAPVYPSTSD